MMKKMKVINFMLIAAVLLFWSCQSEQSPIEVENNAVSTVLTKTVDKATLIIDIERLEGGPYTLEIFNVLEEWKEDQISWNSRLTNIPWTKPLGGGTYDLNPSVTYLITKKELLEIPITELFNDGVPQYGLLLKLKEPQGHDQYVRFVSREGESTDELIKIRPKVIINYLKSTNPAGDTFPIIEDASMWKQFPNRLLGTIKPYIFVGNVEGYEMRCVVKFDIPEDILPEEKNCVHTKTYWKAHAKGKKKDPTWDMLDKGTKTKFFKSKKSYHNIISRKSWGNPYYVLASEYAAAELNMLSGADPSEIQGSFDLATALFKEKDPKKVKRMWKDREFMELLMGWTKDLREYNMGDRGPIHCDDYKWKKDDKKWKKWWKHKWGKWKKKP